MLLPAILICQQNMEDNLKHTIHKKQIAGKLQVNKYEFNGLEKKKVNNSPTMPCEWSKRINLSLFDFAKASVWLPMDG